MSNLANSLDRDPAEWWEHEEGDKLVGTVVDRSTRVSEYGPYEIVTVEAEGESTEKSGKPIPEGEERAYHANSTIGKTDVPKLDPRVGDSFGVKYLGVPQGKDYKLYRHRLERRTPEPAAVAPELEQGDEIPF